jgi:hypothetical protein
MRLQLGIVDFERSTHEGMILSARLNSVGYSGVMGGIIMGRFKKIAGILRGSLVDMAARDGVSLESMEIALLDGDRGFELQFPYAEVRLEDPCPVNTGKIPVDEHARHNLELWKALTGLPKRAIVQRLVEGFFLDKADHLQQKLDVFAAGQEISVDECRELLIRGEDFPLGKIPPLISMGLGDSGFDK